MSSPSPRPAPDDQEHGDIAEQHFAFAYELAMAAVGRAVGPEVSEALYRCLPPKYRASILRSCLIILGRREGGTA